jgi:hypothetical protein
MVQSLLVRRPHSDERGTTIFVVVLVVTLLTGIGLFAARVTGSVDAATGNARQSAQARALAIYAAQLAPVALGLENEEVTRQRDASLNATFTQCATNRYLPRAECALYQHRQLVSLATRNGATDGVLAAQTAENPGSLGPKTDSATLLGIEGNMSVEYFERVKAPAASGTPGDSQNAKADSSTYEYSITASAQIRPVIGAASPDWCSAANVTSNANVQSVRMYVTAP